MIIEDSDRYGIVVDAGSSGSRIHIYKWQDPNTISINCKEAHSVPQIYQSNDWVYKVSPGLSSFEDHPKKAFSKHIKPLLKFAESVIPHNQIKDTPIFIQATAGMRLLKPKKQQEILQNVCKGIKKSTDFLLTDCESQIQVIDGETEGIFGWLSLNYLGGYFNNYDPTQSKHFTYGFMDMGGASAQIAFEPSDKNEISKHREDIAKINLKSVNGDTQEWNVFVSTWLGFGANQARQRYLAQLVNALPENTNNYDDDDFKTRTLYDPCMPKGYKHEFEFKDTDFTAVGQGDFEQCTKSIYPLLLKNMPCHDEPCLFNGVHTPKIDFTTDRFIGVSEYWYIPNDIFKLGGPYDFDKFNKGVEQFCNTQWDLLQDSNKKGDYNGIPDEFLAASCFKSTWILNILHEGFEMPKNKAIDSQNDATDNDPVFQSLADMNGTEISWTLGRILLFVSGSVTRGNKVDNVGIFPSKIEAETFGKTFISGTLLKGSSINKSTSNFFINLIVIVVILSLFYYIFVYQKMRVRYVHISKLHNIVNSITRNYRNRGKGPSYEALSKLEEGVYDKATQRVIDDERFISRSQSTGNLSMNSPINGTVNGRSQNNDKEQSPFMRSNSRGNTVGPTSFQMSDFNKNRPQDHSA